MKGKRRPIYPPTSPPSLHPPHPTTLVAFTFTYQTTARFTTGGKPRKRHCILPSFLPPSLLQTFNQSKPTRLSEPPYPSPPPSSPPSLPHLMRRRRCCSKRTKTKEAEKVVEGARIVRVYAVFSSVARSCLISSESRPGRRHVSPPSPASLLLPFPFFFDRPASSSFSVHMNASPANFVSYFFMQIVL